jgi:hypothetical protein
LTHLAFPALYKHYIHRRAGRAFIDSIKQQVLLGGKKTLSKTLKLEVVKLAVGFLLRLWTSDSTL